MQENNKNNNRKKRGKLKPFDGIIRRTRVPKNTLENKSEIIFARKNVFSVIKMTSALAVSVLLFTAFSSVGGTLSYFNDTEISSWNKLQAGILGFNLIGGVSGAYARVALGNAPPDQNTGSATFDVTINAGGDNLPMLYTATGRLDSTNPDGCNSMALKADFGDYSYDGPVLDFVSPPKTTTGEWKFVASLPVDRSKLSPDTECRGEIIFRAGLDAVPDDLIYTFSDEKSYAFSVISRSEVLVSSEEDSPSLETQSTLSEPGETQAPESVPEVIPEASVVEAPNEDTAPPSTEVVPEGDAVVPPPVEEPTPAETPVDTIAEVLTEPAPLIEAPVVEAPVTPPAE